MMVLVPSPAVSSTLLSAFFLFLFFSSFVSAGDQCPPSSCGSLTNISYPFRLKDDPPHCGDPNYELTCDYRNHTILTLLSHNYYITDITYDDFDMAYGNHYVDFEIQVKDVGMDKYNKSSSCHLPLPASSLTFSNLSGNKYYEAYNLWATLVNCSNEVKNQSRHYYRYIDDYYYDYMPVSCLSDNNSSSFIYLIISNNSIANLKPSCRFLAMFPSNFNWYLSGKQPTDICKLLDQGFSLHRRQLIIPNSIRLCLKTSLR